MPTELAPPPAQSPNAAQTQAAPAASAIQAEPSSAAPSTDTKTADPMQDVFTPAAKPAKAAPAAPAKDTKEKPAEGTDKGAVKKPDEAAPAGAKQTVGAKKEGDSPVISQIRNAEKAARAETARITAEFEEYKKKGGGDTSALTTSLAEKDKRIKELEGEVGALNHRKHPDFVNNFEKPYLDAQQRAKNIIESLKVITGKDAEGNDIVHRADWNKDFISITRSISGTSPAEIRANAIDQIEAKFGKYADQAMNQFDKLYELNQKRDEALNEYASKSEEIEAQNRSKQLERADNFKKAYNLARTDLLEQDQAQFGERPDDTEGNELMKKMDAIIRPLFHNPETLAPQEFVAKMAASELRLLNYPRLQRDLAAALDRAAELEARINGTEESTNGKTRKTGEEIAGQDPEEKDRQKMREAWA